MITIRELPAEEKGATRQSVELRCELWNETDATIRVYICDSDWLRTYLVPPNGIMREVWVRKGWNAISAFDVVAQTCISCDCVDLGGAVCILISRKA
jgi:hypothetical protein